MNATVDRMRARIEEISARMNTIELTGPESGRGPLWREYDRLSRELNDIDAALNVVSRFAR